MAKHPRVIFFMAALFTLLLLFFQDDAFIARFGVQKFSLAVAALVIVLMFLFVKGYNKTYNREK